MLNIDKSGTVPTPPENSRAKYPFSSMEVGDSFLIPPELVSKVRIACHTYAHRTGKKFSVRMDGAGHRCWRLK